MNVKTTPPPGKKIVKQMPLKLKWILLGIAGLFVFCYGLYAYGVALTSKQTSESAFRWTIWLIYSFIIIGSGLALIAQATIYKVKSEYRRELRREIKRAEKDWQASLRRMKRDAQRPDVPSN